MLKWLKGLFPSNRANCTSCRDVYAKEAMKEIWFKYTESDGTSGTSSVFVCTPCLEEIQEAVESSVISLNEDDLEFEVD